jgi:hypothetical protein
MGAVKIKAADQYFSRCVRERASWCCERCGAQHQEKSMGLHCSHYHGRGRWGVRFDPDNCEALCYGCHSYVGSHPYEHEKRIKEKHGSGLYEILLQKANDTSLGRIAKRSESEIRKHYRLELERMKEQRALGVTGRIEFDNWC